MIRVTVELLPGGLEEHAEVLGIATITNDGTGEPNKGNYKARFSKWAPLTTQTWKRSEVKGFRRRTRGAWDLLYLALREAVGDRNP